MSKEYFECAGVLLVVYGIFRVIIGFQLRNDFEPLPPSETSLPSDIQSNPIDTFPLIHRLEEVRQDYAAGAEAHRPSPVKPLLVAERRAEIAKLAFFQKPPLAPEPPEKEQGLLLLMV